MPPLGLPAVQYGPSAWSFGPYFLGVLALAVLVTPIFNAARGSVLISLLFHLQMNNPAWREAQPWGNCLFAVTAVVVVLLNRKTMTTRDDAVTDLFVPPGAAAHATRARHPHP